MQESLGRENLADRSRERRKPRLGANASDLLENVEQAVGRAMRAKVNLERGDEAGGKVVLRGANGDAGRDRRDRLVPDELVDDVGGLPELVHVEPGGLPDPLERLGERLARHAVQRQRERVDRGRDEVRPRLDGGERRGQAHAGRALDVEADGELARLPDPRHQLGRAVRGERAGRVVDDDARRAELGQLARLLDERVRLPGPARAVHEPGVERPTGARDRRARLAEVRDVVQRVVQPEDLDAVLGGARHEATDDVSADRPRADQEPSAQRDPQRSRTRARIARIRSQGLSTRRRTVASKTPPPETSRHAKPARSRISATRSTSAVGSRPVSGSCESSRTVVSTSLGTPGPYRPTAPVRREAETALARAREPSRTPNLPQGHSRVPDVTVSGMASRVGNVFVPRVQRPRAGCSECLNRRPDSPRTAKLEAASYALRAADVATLARIDLDPLAGRDEQRNLDDGAGLERRGLHHVRDRVAANGGLRPCHRELDRRR